MTEEEMIRIERERERYANTLRYLEAEGLAEGRDWHWGTPEDWDLPCVCDAGDTLEVDERVTPLDPDALPIMIRSSGVRKLRAPRLAALMGEGRFPSEMPFVVVAPGTA